MKKKKIAFWIIFLGIFLYMGIYYYSFNSEGFKFIQDTYLNSPSIEARIGKVKAVELPLFGAFKEKHINKKILFTARIRCIGENDVVLIDVVAEKNPNWKIKKEIYIN